MHGKEKDYGSIPVIGSAGHQAGSVEEPALSELVQQQSTATGDVSGLVLFAAAAPKRHSCKDLANHCEEVSARPDAKPTILAWTHLSSLLPRLRKHALS